MKIDLKRVNDLTFLILAIPFWVPLIGAVAITVRAKLGSPVFFRQRRPGLHGKPFQLVKFRTMTEEMDANGALQPDAQRLTNFGRWLRRTSLDELPELWNVITGEMSLVGPRPLLMQYLPRYTREQRRRHEVPPGLTGWAQINGRNAIEWEEKFALDVWYVENRSLMLDLRILLLTLCRVFKQQDINAGNHATMPEYHGPQSR